MSKMRFKKGVALLLSALMAFSVCSAAAVSVGAVESTAVSSGDSFGDYSYTVLEDGTVEITGYTGSNTEIVIPSEIEGKSVTSIGGWAFSDCTSLTSITIPDSVTSIGNYAFYNCSSLASITLGNGVTYIGVAAFSDTALTSVTIPDSVIEIAPSAFRGCRNLTDINISESVINIGGGAFDDTAWYNNQPDGLIYVGKFAYEYKGEMPENTKIVLKDGTLGIGGRAFFYRSSLTSIIIPDSVISIGWGAFYCCTGLTSITIPDGVISIGDRAFKECYQLESINLPQTVKNIGFGAFGKCEKLKEIEIPAGVEVLDNGVFYKCTSLTNVIIPYGVKEIRGHGSAQGYMDETAAVGCFDGCTSLTSITIPDSVTSIGKWAFPSLTIYGYKGTAAETYANDNGFEFVSLGNILKNDETGISVTLDNNAELVVETLTDSERIDKANVALVNKAEVLALYDISLLKDGVAVQPDGTAKVKIPTDNENAKVYRIEADGTATDMNAVYENGYLVFTTDHFSVYAVAEPVQAVLGDVTGDGKVKLIDAITIQKAALSMTELSGQALINADVNGDSKVNLLDAILAQKLALGMTA